MLRLADRVPASWKRIYAGWLARRIPAANAVVLNQRNLFIFLSRQGMYFLLLVALIWMGATNYQNNLAYALAFLLLSVLFVCILQTFSNLSGLRLRLVDAEPVFAGDMASFRIALSSPALQQQLHFFWRGQQPEGVSVAGSAEVLVKLQHQTDRRGYLQPGRLCVQTFFPLGLIRCWTWLDLAAEVLVYPRPEPEDYRVCMRHDGDEKLAMVAGSDEYFALKPYVAGEALARVAWKHYAAGRGLFVRDYADFQGGDIWLDFAAMSAVDTELRLSQLCYCALQLHALQRPFGLRLPGQQIAPGSGEPHLRAVLRLLALFPS